MNANLFQRSLTSGAILVLLAGCTHLEVNRFEGSGTPASRTGYAYMLDFTQYEIKVTRTLVECSAGELPKIKVEAAATASLVPDGAQVYVIDTQSLISAFKTSDVSIDYKDGRLVGFNAVTEDKTADVIKSAAVTAGKIALLASGIPAPVNGGSPPVFGCSAEAIQKLTDRDADKKQLVAATGSLDTAKDALTDLTTRYTAAPTAQLAKQLRAQKAVVDAAQKNVDGLQKKIDAANAWLTRTATATWPGTSAEFDSDPMLPLDAATIDVWFDRAGLRQIVRSTLGSIKTTTLGGVRRLDNDGPAGNAARARLTLAQFQQQFPALADPNFSPDACVGAAATPACSQLDQLLVAIVPDAKVDAGLAQFNLNSVSFHLAVRGSYGGTQASASATQDAKAGLRYRVPAAAWLFVCEGNASCAAPADQDRVVLRQAETIAQLGAVFNLPFSSPAFASGSLGVTFDDKGRLLRGQLKRTNAAALSAAEAAGSVVDQAQAYDKAARAEPLASLNRRVSIAKAQKELADAQKALLTSPKASLEEELAILEAQKKVNEARAALGGDRGPELLNQIEIAQLESQLAEGRRKLEADPNAGLVAVKAQYDAETAVLNARKAKLEAEAAVAAAERALQAN